MNLTYSPTRRASRARAAQPAAVAILYPKVGNVLRVALRRTRIGGTQGCAQHPERQFIRWFNRMAAARPGFPMQVKSILLLTAEPLCESCRRVLNRYLGQYQLAGKLRVRSQGEQGCGCARPATWNPSPASTMLDALLLELAGGLLHEDPPASAPPALATAVASSPAPTSVPTLPTPNKHRSPAFKKAKAELKRTSIDNPDLPNADRGWLKQERNQRGNNPRKWRNPPGKDVGHVDPSDNTRVRWEGASQNRSRGGKFKRELAPADAAFLANPFSRELELFRTGELAQEGVFQRAAEWVKKRLAQKALTDALNDTTLSRPTPYNANPSGPPPLVAPVRPMPTPPARGPYR